VWKNPAALQFLTQTGAPGTYYHTLFKGTFHPLDGTQVSIVSRLKNAYLTRLLLFIYTDLKWI
jgi:hypothetical protein